MSNQRRQRDESGLVFQWPLLGGFILLHAVIAVVAFVTPAMYGSAGRLNVFSDVGLYGSYANQIVAEGKRPYRDFRIEYPLLSVPLIVGPRLLADNPDRYAIVFAVEMFLFDAATLWLLTAGARTRREVMGRLAWYTGFIAILSPLMLTRLDTAVMAILFGAAVGWLGERPIAGGVACAAAALAKISPGVLAPFGLIRNGRRWQGGVAFCVTLVGGGLVWLVIGGVQGVGESLHYQFERGLQLESVYSSVLQAVAWAAGQPVQIADTHASSDLVSPAADLLARLSIVIQLLLIAIAVYRYYRSSRRNDPAVALQFATAGVVGFIIGGKILSPQFVLWVVPLIAMLERRPLRWVFLFCCLATAAVYPWLARQVRLFEPVGVVALNARNALLIAEYILLLTLTPRASAE